MVRDWLWPLAMECAERLETMARISIYRGTPIDDVPAKLKRLDGTRQAPGTAWSLTHTVDPTLTVGLVRFPDGRSHDVIKIGFSLLELDETAGFIGCDRTNDSVDLNPEIGVKSLLLYASLSNGSVYLRGRSTITRIGSVGQSISLRGTEGGDAGRIQFRVRVSAGFALETG